MLFGFEGPPSFSSPFLSLFPPCAGLFSFFFFSFFFPLKAFGKVTKYSAEGDGYIEGIFLRGSVKVSLFLSFIPSPQKTIQ